MAVIFVALMLRRRRRSVRWEGSRADLDERDAAESWLSVLLFTLRINNLSVLAPYFCISM